MPKYVFEVSALLPEADELGPFDTMAISVTLVAELRKWLTTMHHVRSEVVFDDPFELVSSDGPIHLEPEEVTTDK